MGMRAKLDKLVDGLLPVLRLLFTCAVGLYLAGITFAFCASEAKLYWTFHVSPPDEFNHCILNRMPGTANDAVFEAVYTICKQYPVTPLRRYSIYSMSSAEDCVIHFGSDTENLRAAVEIMNSCHKLFRPLRQ